MKSIRLKKSKHMEACAEQVHPQLCDEDYQDFDKEAKEAKEAMV